MLLDVTNLEVSYGDYQVVWGVSLSIDAGESVALLGPNGSGKSTVVNTITGLLPVKAGDIRFEGASLVGRPTHTRASLGIAHVLERRRVFPHLTVMQNLTLGAWHPAARDARPKTTERVFSLFPRLRERKSQLARTLSGGEQQMVAIARATMSRPRLLLLDEPSLGLAPIIVAQIMRQIVALRSARGTVLIVEQNAHAALAIADRGYVLENGRIALEGAANELLVNPAVQEAYLGGQGGHYAIEGRIRSRKLAILGR
jgi:branched-chain amino acid transport system ATP-binding protein